MTVDLAAAVTVSIPIFALAAGAEARSVRDRLQRPDPEWEREFAQFSAEQELEVGGSAAQVFDYFRNVPKPSRLRAFERGGGHRRCHCVAGAVEAEAAGKKATGASVREEQQRPGLPADPKADETA